MLKTWIKSWALRFLNEKETLGEILESPDNREFLLGVKRTPFHSKEKIESDMDSLLRYSRSEDYAIFCQHTWAEFLDALDKLMDDKISDRQVDFYRGAMSKSLKILRSSYIARNLKQENRDEKRVQDKKVV